MPQRKPASRPLTPEELNLVRHGIKRAYQLPNDGAFDDLVGRLDPTPANRGHRRSWFGMPAPDYRRANGRAA
ncbi:MAG: hypothetical protein JF593_16040 [Novosphingobium sp.]|nr:hypothetical protein [Novosphingobium sp.]